MIELPSPLGEDEQRDLVKKLKYEYDQFRGDLSPLHDRLTRYHELYETYRSGEKEFPWPGASNFQVPLVMAVVDSIHARIVKAVFEVDPLWLAQPRTPQAVDQAKIAEAYLDYWADEMGVAEKLDMVIHNRMLEGVGVFKTDWVRRTRQVPGGVDQSGNPVEPTTVVEYEGPTGRPVPLKDFVLIPSDSPTIEDAVYVGHRVFRTHQQMLDRAAAGHYFNVERLLEASKGDSTHDRTPITSRVLGSSGQGHGTFEETRQYEVVELYGPFDWGEGPIPTLFAFSPQHDILLRVEPYPYEYGRPPYIDFCVYRRPNLFWGRGVPEMLESAQEELTALHNMRSDAIAKRVAPPVLHRLGSGWDPDEQPLAPAAAVEVTDPAEMFEMSVADIPGSLFAHEQDILAFVERVTGQSDYFMGRSPSQNRTATEVNRVTSEGLVRMDVIVSRFQQGMKRLAWVLWWMLFQYRPYLDSFTDENAADPLTITKEMMRPGANGQMPFEFIPQGEQSDASKEARRQQLTFLLQTAANPLSQFYPDGIQELLREIFDAFGIKSTDKILGPPWSVIQQQLQMAFQQGVQEGVKQGAQASGGS